MGTQHLASKATFCEIFDESELCQDEILAVLQSLDDNSSSNIFNASAACTSGMKNKNRTSSGNKKRKKPAKSTSSSSSLRLRSDEESDEGHAVLSQRQSFKRQKGSLSPPAESMKNGSGEDVVGDGGSNNNDNVVSHIAVERNRRKQMNEHLTVLRQLMPCFYVKKGDQASIVGGVIDYINELHHVLQSLEAKKRRKISTSQVGPSPKVPSSPVFLGPRQHLNTSSLNPRKPQISPRTFVNFPVTPTSSKPNSLFYKPHGQQMVQPWSSNSFSSIASMTQMMSSQRNNNNGVANELVARSKSDFADVEVKFCGPNLELKTLSSRTAGQTLKIVSTMEDLSLEILQLSINTVEEAMLNAFTIKIGIDCQLSAVELAQQIQQTFC